MEPDEILAIARRVASSTRRRWKPGCPVSREEFEDWQQQAAYGILLCLRDDVPTRQFAAHDDVRAYCFRAGQQALVRWLMREWWRTSLLPNISSDGVAWGAGVCPVRAERWEPAPDMFEVLRELLLATRKQQGPRNQAAVERDLQILRRLCNGWTNKEIGDDLGISNLHVRKYRQELVRRLRRLAEAVQAEDRISVDRIIG